jgi:hypothetical protein
VLVIDVPIWAVRFPARAANGSTPAPRPNEIAITSVDHTGKALCSEVDWVELSIGVLAPIIMVHGNGQGDDNLGGMFWAGEVLLEDPGKPRFNMGFRFIDALEHIPFDNSISMLTAPIDDHAVLLAKSVPEIAASFGARHAHLVAHSKGGLDSRAFMADTIPANFGILSLITLSTPHQGSSGPDYQIDAVGAHAAHSDSTARTNLAKQTPPNRGTPSLRVDAAAEFNRRNVPALPNQFVVDGETDPVAYRSVSADMNLNNSTENGEPTIEYDEATALAAQGYMPDFVYTRVVQTVYRIVGGVHKTYTERIVVGEGKFPITVVREVPAPQFRPNDAAVTQESASVGPFQEIDHIKRNHSTIAHPNTGTLVLNEIRKIQPMPSNP